MYLLKLIAALFSKTPFINASGVGVPSQTSASLSSLPVASPEQLLSLRNEGKISLPKHIAIIMDGNNRWAKQQGHLGFNGHRAGVEVIRKVLKACDRYDTQVLTLFAFSSENWQRPADEVEGLMQLFKAYLDSEVQALHEQNIQLRFIGRRDRLSAALVSQMSAAEQLTQANQGRVLVLAVDYGGRWDILQACKQVLDQKENNISDATLLESEEDLNACLSLADLPDPDLCIRTGGEHRISNFMMWQFSYAELYFTDCYWPAFDETEFGRAITAFAGRQRRFGKTSEQVEQPMSTAQPANQPLINQTLRADLSAPASENSHRA